MNIVKAIFSRHRNADMKLHRHAEKYIFGEGLAFEYYYLIHAVISVIPFSGEFFGKSIGFHQV